jgi:hypothetical protein
MPDRSQAFACAKTSLLLQKDVDLRVKIFNGGKELAYLSAKLQHSYPNSVVKIAARSKIIDSGNGYNHAGSVSTKTEAYDPA